MKNSKYLYMYVLQGFYLGWEDLTASESLLEVKQNKEDYLLNERGHYRIIKRRVLNVI